MKVRQSSLTLQKVLHILLLLLLLLLLAKLQIFAANAAWIVCRGIVEERPIAAHIVVVVVVLKIVVICDFACNGWHCDA